MKFSDLDAYSLLENLQTGVVVHDKNTKIRYANPKALEILRLTEDQARGIGAYDPLWRFLDKNKQAMSVADYPVNQVIASHKPLSNFEVGIYDSSSKDVTWVLCNAYPEFTDNKQLEQVVVTFVDITSQKQNICFENIVEMAKDVIIVTDSDPFPAGGPKMVYVNEAFTRLTGYTKDEAIGQAPSILQGIDTCDKTRQEIRNALCNQDSVQTQILNYSKEGEPYWLDLTIFPLHNSEGEVTHFAAIERDITEQKDYESTLKELSIRDPLTTLLNRRGFFEMASSLLSQSKRNLSPIVVAMIDIDFFKNINDAYGHDIGDQALQHMSLHMQSYFRKSDIIARMGGEEFALLMTNSDINSCIDKFETFLAYLAENPLKVEKELIPFTVSVGLTQPTEGSKNVSDILKAADKALYKAKHNGRNKVSVAD